MIRVVESESPPLRLLLGSDALGLREKKFGELQGEIAAWRAVGEATAFDGAEVVPVGG